MQLVTEGSRRERKRERARERARDGKQDGVRAHNLALRRPQARGDAACLSTGQCDGNTEPAPRRIMNVQTVTPLGGEM